MNQESVQKAFPPLSSIRWGAVVDRLGFVDRLWFMVDRFGFMVDRLGFMVDRLWLMVDRLWFMVGGGGRVVRLGLGVDRGALVGDLCHVAVVVVCCVLHMLDTPVRKLERKNAGIKGDKKWHKRSREATVKTNLLNIKCQLTWTE